LRSLTSKSSIALVAAAVAGLFLVVVMAAQSAYAANDQNDKNNLRCTGDPHDDKDSGNAHEPPNESGNPHFCPPIGS
jgi:hypothetical protein